MSVVFQSLVRPNFLRFAIATLLNFGCRILSLVAFISSIQALQIAFQYVVSNGETFKGRELFELVGLETSHLPLIVSLVIAVIFALPSLLKSWETTLISGIADRVYAVVERAKAPLLTDVFVVTRVPAFLNYTILFLSGCMFLFVALMIILVFRVDLFLLIMAASVVIMISIVITGGRRINQVQAVIPVKNDYIEEARDKYREELGEKKRRAVTDVPLRAGALRQSYFDLSIANWARTNRASFNSSIVVGCAMGLVIWFIFQLHDLDASKLVFLLYLIIAIRYAINTARDTGAQLTKLLETRAELANLRLIITAYQTKAG